MAGLPLAHCVFDYSSVAHKPHIFKRVGYGNEFTVKLICMNCMAVGCKVSNSYFCMTITLVGVYGEKKAILCDMEIMKTTLGGSFIDERKTQGKRSTDADNHEAEHTRRMKGWFKFVQTEDGSVPAVYHAREEEQEVLNIKKAIAKAFQANFKGTATKVESDPQSLHVSEYT